MDREQALTPPQTGRLFLLGALFLVTAPHLIRMPLWLSLLCIGVFGWRLLHELRGHDLPGRLLRSLLVIGGVAAVAVTYRTIIGQEAGVALLSLMLCLKLLELHTMRDAMIALFIGYFMVIGGFLFDQSIFMGAYLFMVVLALTAALIALNHPAGGTAELRHYLRSGGTLLLQAIPLMVIMFLLFPRLSSPLWSMPNNEGTARTGLADSMEMGSINNLVASREVAFRVEFDGPIPPASLLYWRGPVLWKTDGRQWQPITLPPAGTLPAHQPLGDEVEYSVTLEPHNRRWLFAMDLPVEMPRELNGRARVQPDFQLLFSRDVTSKLRYRIRSAGRYRLLELTPAMRKAATQLPAGRNPATRALAARWRAEGLDGAAIMQRAYSHFRDQPFYYTRQPPRLGTDPVDEFLFTTRRGFCEHFAAAYVTLMRAAGIPARVVTGYQGGELNELGNYLIVRQSNAHAWAEVWQEGEGWVRVDPTTAIPPGRVETPNDALRFQSTSADAAALDGNPALRELLRNLRHGWDAVNHTWNQWVLGFNRQKQQELLRRLGLDTLSWSWLITAMAGLIAVALAIIAALTLLRRPRQRDPLLRLYQRFCDKLEKAGIHRRIDEGPADFTARVVALRPDLAPAVEPIGRLYVRLRYTRHGNGEEIATLRRMIRNLRP